MTTHNKSETVRRNFTMDKEEANRIDRIASEHFNDNASQAVRTGVGVLEQHLNGLGLTELKKMRSSVDSVGSGLENLQKEVDEIHKLVAGIGTGVPESESMNTAMNDPQKTSTERTSDHHLATDIMDIIDTTQPVIMETIVAETNGGFSSVYRKTNELINKGVVTRVSESSDNPQYRLAEATS